MVSNTMDRIKIVNPIISRVDSCLKGDTEIRNIGIAKNEAFASP